MRRWIVAALAMAFVLSAQGSASALALHWEIVRTSGVFVEEEIPPGVVCDFGIIRRSEGSYQEMFGYDDNGVLRVYRWQNWGPWSYSLIAETPARTTLTTPRQSMTSTYYFGADGQYERTVNTGIDNLWVAPGSGVIAGNVGRFIMVGDDELVWKAGLAPTPSYWDDVCAALS
jgi:hypothetical protein